MLLSRAHNEHSQHAIARTPGRSILKGRAGLQENTLHGSTTGNAKANVLKSAARDAIQPFALQPQRLKKDIDDATERPSPSKQPTIVTNTRPLLDKTPFPNRIVPNPSRSLITLAPLLDVVVQEGVVEGEQEEDDSDIEYMPPTAIFPDYEPPYDMPCYTALGASLLSLAQSHAPSDEIQPQEYEFEGLDVNSPNVWPHLTLRDIDDDNPFPEDALSSAAKKLVPTPLGDGVHKQKPVPVPRLTTARSFAPASSHTPAPWSASSPSSTRPPTRLTAAHPSASMRSHAPTPYTMQRGTRRLLALAAGRLGKQDNRAATSRSSPGACRVGGGADGIGRVRAGTVAVAPAVKQSSVVKATGRVDARGATTSGAVLARDAVRTTRASTTTRSALRPLGPGSSALGRRGVGEGMQGEEGKRHPQVVLRFESLDGEGTDFLFDV